MPEFISNKRIEELAKRPWGKIFPKKIELMRQGFCTTCKTKVKGFKDELSHKEFRISGMCQNCQDSVFEEK